MKKFLVWLLLAAMVLSCVTSASAVVSDNGVVYFGYEGIGYEPVVEGEPLVVTITHKSDPNLTYFGTDTEEDNWYLRAVEEQLNIDIVYDRMLPYGEYYTTLNLSIAGAISGNEQLADAMVVDTTTMQELAEAGLIYDMTEIYNTYASDYTKEIFAYTGVIFDGCTIDGKLYGIPRQESGNSGAAMAYIRKDWLDKLDLDAPKTLEDLVNVARAFKNQDPDGNGEDDTWGFGVSSSFYRSNTGDGATSASLESIFHALGSFPSLFMWNEDETEIIYGGLQPETKEALAYINALVEEGLVQKEFATMSYDQVNEACWTNKCGLVIAPWWQCVAYDMALEGGLWLCYAAPLDAEGYYTNPMINPSGEYIVVSAEASPEVAEAVMKICNIQAYAGGRMLCEDILGEVRQQPGYEGLFFSNSYFPFVCNLDAYNKHSSFAGDAAAYYRGEVTYDDLPGEIQGLIPKFDILMGEPYNGDFSSYFQSDDFVPWVSNYLVYLDSCLNLDIADETGIARTVAPATFNTSASESWVEYGASLIKMQSEYFTKIALGELSIDAFDEFVELWLDLGGADVLDELAEIAK